MGDLQKTTADKIPYIGIDEDGDGKIDTIPVLIKDGKNYSLGSISVVAVTDPSANASAIALLKGLLMQLQGDGSGRQPVLIDSLNSTINVNKMGKGEVTPVHSAIIDTATSEAVNCQGYNSLQVVVMLSDSKNWTIHVLGCSESGGNFVNWHELATGNMTETIFQTNTSMGLIFKGIPDFIKIIATKDEDGASCTVMVQPLNL